MPVVPVSGWRCIFCSAASSTWRPRQGQRLHAAAAATMSRTQASGDKTLSGRPLGRHTIGYDDPAQASDDKTAKRRPAVRRTLGYADSPHQRVLKRGVYVSVVRRDPESKDACKAMETKLVETQIQAEPREGMRKMVEEELQAMRRKLKRPEFHAITGLEAQTAEKTFREFERGLTERMVAWPQNPRIDAVWQRLNDARMVSKLKMAELIKFWLQHHIVTRRLARRPRLQQRLREACDLRHPFEWFPETHRLRRTIHLHIGPTNSGKTYHALKQLEKAKRGVYAGPLRLLAYEVYQRLNAAGRPCALRTGDEQLDPPNAVPGEIPPLVSCTVEMTPRDQIFDVAVIDEIQMISSSDRGSAWALALLSLQATEVHLCGEERTLTLIRDIVQGMGDEFVLHRYERLSPLAVKSSSLDNSWRKLRPGDCVVAFSVRIIHALRETIERETGMKVAIVYGALPPDIRAQQAALFNDPNSGYDILVASDAVGMGLNLNIKCIVFYTMQKRTPYSFGPLDVATVKQIAGRAGRFKVAPVIPTGLAGNQEEPNQVAAGPAAATSVAVKPVAADPAAKEATTVLEPPAQTLGYVTTLMNKDLPLVRQAMAATVPPLTKAGILPTDEMFYRFASLFPRDTPFSYILQRLFTSAQLHPLFRIDLKHSAIATADLLQKVSGLSIPDRLTLLQAPISSKNEEMVPIARELANCIANHRPGHILDLESIRIEVLDHQGPSTLDHLQKLEVLHKSLVLYSWLSYRYETIFETRATAMHLKGLVEKRIEQALFELGTEFQTRLKRDMRKRKREEQNEARKSIPMVYPEGVDEPAADELQSALPMDEGSVPGLGPEAVPVFDVPTNATSPSSNA